MTCYVLGCSVSPVLSAIHRRYGPVAACRRHYPGPLSLPLTERAGWVSAPVLTAPAPFQGPGAELWEGPRMADSARGVVRLINHAWTEPGHGDDETFGDRQPAPPPPPVRPPQGPAVVAPVPPRTVALPAEHVAPARDASALIAF